MFFGCEKLEKVDMEKVKADTILYMQYMFYGCKNLKYLNIKNLNTKQTILFNYIFKDVNKDVNVVYNPNITDETLQKEIYNIIR